MGLGGQAARALRPGPMLRRARRGGARYLGSLDRPSLARPLAHSRTPHLPFSTRARIPRSGPSPLPTPPLLPAPSLHPVPHLPSSPVASPAFSCLRLFWLLVWVCSGWAISAQTFADLPVFPPLIRGPGSPAQQLPHPELGSHRPASQMRRLRQSMC